MLPRERVISFMHGTSALHNKPIQCHISLAGIYFLNYITLSVFGVGSPASSVQRGGQGASGSPDAGPKRPLVDPSTST